MVVLSAFLFAQQAQYSRIKLQADQHQLIDLAGAGIDVTEGVLKEGACLVAELSEYELVKLDELGLEYEVLIPDVSKYYVDRNAGKSANASDYKGTSEWAVPENFTFGSMSGHATFEEVVEHLDNMYALFPDLITQKESIGQSIEGRDLWMVKISDNPGDNESEPEVLYTSLHHAREPAGLMTNLFFMYYLLENYDNDPFIQTLVDNTELYFVPVINPDGYVYNESTNPSGGGMWRKNMRDNGVPGCIGVDLNRNYDYMWGLDDIGSSPDPCDATYRGESPFSEPETQAIRDLCESHEFMNAMNYHTHGNLLLYAWGYTDEPCEDDPVYYAHSVLYTADNNYTFGAGSTTIYPTNGGSDDWMYGEQSTKNKIFAYTPELGGGFDGFWCAIDRIIPIAQENMIMNILTAAFAGWYADVQVASFPLVSETEGYIHYDVSRLGLMDDGVFTVNLEPLSDFIISEPVDKTYADMELLESIADSIPYSLNEGTPSGTPLMFRLTVDNGQYEITDTIHRIFGETEVVFEDGCDDMTNWISPNWDVTTASYFSPTGSITDSPGGDYPNSHVGAAIMVGEIDLSETNFAMLDFHGRWEIEAGYDFVQLQVSQNGGSSWEALEGLYTVTGTPDQAEGQPVYDGFQTEWVHEQIDISAYTGGSVTFRFFMKTDNWVTEDGFYFDDFRVFVVEVSPVGIRDEKVDEVSISGPFPNPATDVATFTYTGNSKGSGTRLNIHNAAGQLIATRSLEQASGTVQVSLNGWPAGVYYYRIDNSESRSESGKLIVY
jgi:murein tripeptide amidase MpaA